MVIKLLFVLNFTKFIIDSSKSLNLLSNNFHLNEAFDDGAVLYFSECSGNSSIMHSIFRKNSIVLTLSTNLFFGSTNYFENPGNITIFNCSFINNTGVTGTSIYYSENSKYDMKFI